MNLLGKKRNFIPSKLTFKPKNKISPVIYKDNKRSEEKNENFENISIIPFEEENKEKKIFKEFISEKELKQGLNPKKSYSKLSKTEPLPKEYKIYKKIKLTNFEKIHLQKIEKEKMKLTPQQKKDKWNFDSNYDKYQKLLTSIPDFNEMPRISGA